MTLIIFDCDGVLINSTELRTTYALNLLQTMGLRIDHDAYTANFMGLTSEEWLARVKAALKAQDKAAPKDSFLQEIDSEVHRLFEARLASLKGARDMIEQLKLPYCVASNTKGAYLDWKLRHVGLFDLFDPYIYSGDMVARGKPAPDLFWHAAADREHKPKQCVVVEDSVVGIDAAKSAGMTAIGFTLGGHCGPNHNTLLRDAGADFIVGSFNELNQLLAKQI